MKKIKNYSEAIERLNKLVTEIESGELTVDDLTSKVKDAKELVAFCSKQLRETESELNDSLEELQ